MRGPEFAELVEPRIQFLETVRIQPVETALRVDVRLDETGLAQHAQVLRHGRLRHAKPALDFADRLLGRGQQAQDRPAVRLDDDFKYGCHGLYIPQKEYTCKGIYTDQSDPRLR